MLRALFTHACARFIASFSGVIQRVIQQQHWTSLHTFIGLTARIHRTFIGVASGHYFGSGKRRGLIWHPTAPARYLVAAGNARGRHSPMSLTLEL